MIAFRKCIRSFKEVDIRNRITSLWCCTPWSWPSFHIQIQTISYYEFDKKNPRTVDVPGRFASTHTAHAVKLLWLYSLQNRFTLKRHFRRQMLKSPFLSIVRLLFFKSSKGLLTIAISSISFIFWRSHYRSFVCVSIVPKTSKLETPLLSFTCWQEA